MILAVFAFVIVTMQSCKKEEINREENLVMKNNNDMDSYMSIIDSKIPYLSIRVEDKVSKGEKGSSQILVFDNMKSLVQTINDLDNQVESLDSIFYARNSHLSSAERSEIQEKINFDSSKPITSFNTFLQFSSLFQDIKEKEDIWLSNDSLDYEKDPSNHFIDEESIMAILNTDCEVQVADTIYKFVYNGYYATPTIISNNKESESRNTIFYDNYCLECKDNCSSGNYSMNYVTNEGKTRKIKCTLSHRTYPWNRYVKAKVTNYMKKKNGGWKKYNAYCQVKVYGYISDLPGDCSKMFDFNPNHNKKTGYKTTLKHKIDVNTLTSSGWVKGYYYGAEGITYNKILDWWVE
ncbi:MAG: hypothetical protein IJZ87_02135 [Bacteroidales bacterium]|nr:hypothetical protein [Bacteroidales bacterium]